MKIAICTIGNDLDAKLDDRFGRSDKYLIFDDQTEDFYTIENMAKNESAGAGGKAVQLLVDHQVEITLTPHVGPKAQTALEAFEVKAFHYGECASVKEAITAYQAGKLQEIVRPKSGLRKA